MIATNIQIQDYLKNTSKSFIVIYKPEALNILKRMFRGAKEWELQQRQGNDYYLVGTYTSKQAAINASKNYF